VAWFQNTQGAANSAFHFSVSLTPAATAAASAVEQAFTVTAGSNSSTLRAGLALREGDMVYVTAPSSGNNTFVGRARVNATGQLVLQIVNPTAGSLTHGAGTFRVFVVRY
jgi:hypothetical protein